MLIGQGGYEVEYNVIYAVSVQEDGTVLLAGRTGGSQVMSDNRVGSSDIATVMLGADGQEIWRWKQVTALDELLKWVCSLQAQTKRHALVSPTLYAYLGTTAGRELRSLHHGDHFIDGCHAPIVSCVPAV